MKTVTVDHRGLARTTSVWTPVASAVDRVLTVVCRTMWLYAGNNFSSVWNAWSGVGGEYKEIFYPKMPPRKHRRSIQKLQTLYQSRDMCSLW